MKNRRRLYIIVAISSLVVALISGTFSYYQASVTNNNTISGTIASLKITLDVTKVTSGEGLIPLQESLISSAAKASCIDDNGYTACQIYKLTLKNESNVSVEVDGYITLTSSTSTNLKWTELTSQTTYGSASKRGMSRSQLVSKDKISANGTKIYYIMVYLNDTNTAQNVIDKGSFGGLVEFNTNDGTISESLGDDTSGGGSLYETIKSQAVADNVSSTYVTSSSGISFSSISSDTNGKGVYMLSSTASDTYPIYYYRGAVDNNNVIFGGFCWKIVRTTETGGVKIIYNGTPTSDNKCTNTTGTSTQIGTKTFNSSYTSPAYVGYMYGTVYTRSTKSLSSDTTEYNYGNSVTYSGGTYTLTDTISSSSWSSIYNGGLNSNHYTCFTTGTTCTNVYYIYYTTSSTAYYITLKNGKTVEDALSEMLDYNTTSSTIKGSSTSSGSIDYWYYNNLLSYADKLEDTVFCNDRSIYNLNGWNPDGGTTRDYLRFGTYGRLTTYKPSLTCSRDVDKFTVNTSNGNGNLDYPVGLLTGDEIALAGGGYNTSNSTYYLYTNQYWWAGSPYTFSDTDADEFAVYSTGYLNSGGVNNAYGARPVVSLSLGVEIVSGGEGTSTNPYVVSQD
jgi:hypothetical protein